VKSVSQTSSFEAMPPAERLLLERRLLQGRKVRPRADTMRKRRDTGPCSLSFAQSRLWLAERINPVPGQYNISRTYRIAGSLNVDALRAAFDALVCRHEVLRTRLVLRDGLPQQVVAAHEPFALRLLDLRQGDGESRKVACDEFVRGLADGAFDLAHDLALRAGIVRLRDHESVLVTALHHVAADGWSLGVLDREVQHFYSAFDRGVPATLEPLPLQYSDFSEWQRDALRGSALEGQLDYWRRQLSSLPMLELPTDRPRPTHASFRGRRERIEIPATIASALKDLARKENATLYMTLLAAFQVLLMRHSGQDDVAVGSPIAGRGRPEIEGLIGFFVNTLVMRGDLTGNPRFSELLLRTRERALDAFAHQDLPFEKLVEELNPERDLRRNPLFQVMFTLQGAHESDLRLPGLELSRLPHARVTSKFDLTLHVTEGNGRLAGSFEYNSDLFDPATIRRMGDHFLRLLDGIVADPECRLGKLPLLTAPERRQLLVEWNEMASDFPAERTVCELFEAQVASHPHAVAVADADAEFTYGELNARANRLAHRLRSLGAGSGALIGVAMERSSDMVVAMLGILKAGGAYVPLDPEYPAERLAFMLHDTALRILVTQRVHLPHFPEYDGRVLCLDRDAADLDRCDAGNLPPSATADALAYVIYTSGSTGEPKGVPVPHRGITRLVCRTNYIALDANDRIAHLSNPSFDAATFEIWGALLNGARLVVLRRDVALDPSRLEARLRSDGVTALFLTTALFNAIVHSVPAAFAGVRTVLFGGEAVDPRRVRECLEAGPPERLVHVYGPTETVTFATWHDVEAVAPDERTLPIGRPVSNIRLAVLDRNRQPVPIGVAGELYIGGEGIAHGYWNRPELTDDRFIADIDAARAGARMYRSGDLVRYRADGNLEFLGRLDQQLKLRGHRIEPGEIETVLRNEAALSEALVVLREDSPGERELVAYVVAGTGAPAPTAAGLRTLLKSKLPDYMLPSAFVLLPSLPLTPNGKVDRDALPPPAAAPAGHESTFVAPRDNVELHLVKIWEDLLKRQSIGVRDNFFDLGGHSLLAVQLMKRIDVTFNRTLELDLLWSTDGSVEALAKVLRDGFRAGDNPELIPIKTGARRPLFVMFTIAGRLFFYYELARRLAPEQAVYGLQARGVFDAGRPDTTIPSIAAHCIDTMRKLQPHGPYLLAGYSAGGVVAYEVAQQLVAAGQKVELLALLDTFAPPATIMGRLRRGLMSLVRGKSDLRQLQELAYFAVLHSLKLGRLRQLRTTGEAHRWAHWSYRPAPSATPIELFVAEKSVAEAVADGLGWTRWTKGSIRIHRLPGSHTDLVKPPIVDDLAARLQACIDAAVQG
jgi:amino acid adenylation domain-containing protein